MIIVITIVIIADLLQSAYLNPVYTIQSVVKPVGQPVECLHTRCSRLFNQLFNRLDKRLYRVNGVLLSRLTYR